MQDSRRARLPRVRPFLVAVAYTLYNNLIGRLPVHALRAAYVRRVLGLEMGRGASLQMHCFLTGRFISIGEGAVINRRCYLDGRGGLTIGRDASISPECYLLSLTHDPQDPGFGALPRPVVVGDRAWIGARALILPGVTLGEGCVVGAGAVVTKDVAPFDIVAGNPARKIGERNRALDYTLSYFPYFDTDIQPE